VWAQLAVARREVLLRALEPRLELQLEEGLGQRRVEPSNGPVAKDGDLDVTPPSPVPEKAPLEGEAAGSGKRSFAEEPSTKEITKTDRTVDDLLDREAQDLLEHPGGTALVPYEGDGGAAPTPPREPIPTPDPTTIPRGAEFTPSVSPPESTPPVTPGRTPPASGGQPGATGTRHLPREFKMPTPSGSRFPETSAQVGRVSQRVERRVKGRGQRVGPGDVRAQTARVPGGRSGTREHWDWHKEEFPEYSSARQYVQGAVDFCRAETTKRFYYRSQGGNPRIGYYDAVSNTFAATSVDGRIIFTYLRPDEGVLRFVSDIRMQGVPRGTAPRNSTPLRRPD
jgi:hypothetical protein